MKNTQNDQKWKKIETFLAVIPVCRVKLEHLKMLTLEKNISNQWSNCSTTDNRNRRAN